LELPAEAWADQCLVMECPNCRQTLRLNPFLLDGQELAQLLARGQRGRPVRVL
jgi:hypothetical protein